jgi:hypothetical protein
MDGLLGIYRQARAYVLCFCRKMREQEVHRRDSHVTDKGGNVREQIWSSIDGKSWQIMMHELYLCKITLIEDDSDEPYRLEIESISGNQYYLSDLADILMAKGLAKMICDRFIEEYLQDFVDKEVTA